MASLLQRRNFEARDERHNSEGPGREDSATLMKPSCGCYPYDVQECARKVTLVCKARAHGDEFEGVPGIVQHQVLCTAHACIHLPPTRRKASSFTKGVTELHRRDSGDARKGPVCQPLIEVFDDIGQYAGEPAAGEPTLGRWGGITHHGHQRGE
jgi:hypothetical protein